MRTHGNFRFFAGSVFVALLWPGLHASPAAGQTPAPRNAPSGANLGPAVGTPLSIPLGSAPAGATSPGTAPLGTAPLGAAPLGNSALGSSSSGSSLNPTPLGSSTSSTLRTDSGLRDPEMLDSPLRHLVRLSAPPQIVTTNGARWLDIQFQGEVPRLGQQRDQIKVVIQMAYADGSPLKDRNQIANVGDSIVGTEISLAEPDVEVRGDAFRAAMFFPLNDLDLIGDTETPLQVELFLRRGNRVLGRNPFTPEKYEFVTISAADMPRLWVQSLKVEVAKNTDGLPGISASGMIYLAGQENLETTVEMAVANAQLAGIESRDPRFRVTDNWVGQGQKVKPTKNVQSFRLSLFVPFEACNIKPGKQDVAVYVRAFNTQRNYIGGTPPEMLTITAP